MNIKDGDKVNILLAFYDKNNKIIQENCFFKKNIKIHIEPIYRKSYYLDKIRDILPINMIPYINKHAPISGFRFCFDNLNKVEFAPEYSCFFIVSKTLSYEQMKNKLFKKLIKCSKDKIKNLNKQVKEEKEQLNLLIILKNFSVDICYIK